MATKQLALVKLNSTLAFQNTPVFDRGISSQQSRPGESGQKTGLGEQAQHCRVSTTTTEDLRSNFSACCDCISGMQEHDLVLALLTSVDDVILKKLFSFEHEPAAMRLAQALKGRQAIEKKQEKAAKDTEKKLLALENTVEGKRRKIENSEVEIQQRLLLREHQLKQNRGHQIEASAYELDYLYKNDPQSLLEDADKFAVSMKQDIDKFKDSISTLAHQASQNQHLVDYYLTLKKAVGEAK